MKPLITIFALSVFFAACKPCENKNDQQIAKNKAAMQAFTDEVINKHNPAMIDSLCTADCIEHSSDASQKMDREGLKKSMADLISGYPDIHETINFMVGDSNTVVAHFTLTGINSGPLMGMPATNKTMKIEGVNIVKFKDGKRAEHWQYMEEMKWMQQMGMLPDMSQSATTKDSTKMKMENKVKKKTGKK